MMLFEHDRWPEILPLLFIRRGRDGVNGPRHRIEAVKDAPAFVYNVVVDCASCGKPIRPFRIDSRGGLTVNASCPLDLNFRCARMPETTKVCAQIREAIEGHPSTTAQGELKL